MSMNVTGRGFLAEAREFFSVMQSWWGLLAGISVFFPLSSTLLSVIPLEEFDYTDYEGGGLYVLSTALVTTLATVSTLFVVVTTFAGRHQLKGAQRKAWISFLSGFAVLLAFLIAYELVGVRAHVTLGWNSENPGHVWVDAGLTMLYCAFFALITRAFMLMGMVEYYRDQPIASST